MRRNIIFASLFALCVVVAEAQAPSLALYPDVTTSQTNASIALLSYKSVVEGNIAATFQLEQNDAAAIQTLQAALNTQAGQIAALQAQVAALSNPTPPPPPTMTTLTFSGSGALNGISQNINWNSGMWNLTAQGVQPAVLGQARNFVMPATQTLVNVQLECLTTNCQVMLTDSVGETVSVQLQAGNIAVLSTGWTKVSGAVSVSTPVSPATDLRIIGLAYN